MYKYSIFETKYGYMGVVASERGLHMVLLPRKRAEDIKKELKKHYTEIIRDEEGLKGVGGRIREYLDGKKVKFREKMDMTGATAFELKVWDATLGIPYGETRSYAWVAKQIGDAKGVRAVGGALGRNRLPIIIPCHRVVSKEGDLGGFSAGVEMKVLLLKIEGALLC
jgi:methylated-DNA-[protein]-cysteine S-methyltransferase